MSKPSAWGIEQGGNLLNTALDSEDKARHYVGQLNGAYPNLTHTVATLYTLDAAREVASAEVIEAGVLAAMEMLRDVQGVGTDRQAFDHVIRRIQDHYGGWDNQVRVGVLRAREALRTDHHESEPKADVRSGPEERDGDERETRIVVECMRRERERLRTLAEDMSYCYEDRMQFREEAEVIEGFRARLTEGTDGEEAS